MDSFIKIVVAIIWVAAIAVIVSNRSKTVDAVRSISNIFSGAIRQIVTPLR